MPSRYLIALAIALIALLASVTTPSQTSDPYAASPLLVHPADNDRVSFFDAGRTGSRSF